MRTDFVCPPSCQNKRMLLLIWEQNDCTYIHILLYFTHIYWVRCLLVSLFSFSRDKQLLNVGRRESVRKIPIFVSPNANPERVGFGFFISLRERNLRCFGGFLPSVHRTTQRCVNCVNCDFGITEDEKLE